MGLYPDNLKEIILSQPDLFYLNISGSEYETLKSSIKEVPLDQYVKYYKNIEKPMPFFLGQVQVDETITFLWDAAFDLQNDPLTYSLTISDDFEFNNIVYEKENIFLTTHEIPMLEKGTYYWRVIAIDSKGFSQGSFDFTVTDLNQYVYGAETLIIEGD
jgi:spore coat protein H